MKIKKLFDCTAFAKAVEESNYTKQQIAELIGCHPSDISRYESGHSTPRHDRLVKMVEILGPSITGLSVSTNKDSALKQFNQDEQRFLAWFQGLPFYRQCRVVGFCEAVVAFGNDIDANFAADLSEQLALEDRRHKEQSG